MTGELPRNSVERRHLEYLSSRGDPAQYLIGAQLERWEARFGEPLTSADIALLRELSEHAPSRYERAELLHLYALAQTNIQTMQSMSYDRQDFPNEAFVIATEPEGFAPSVNTRHSLTCCVGRESSTTRPVDHESVIWMPGDAIVFAATAANLVASRLVPRFGSLAGMVKALGGYVSWTDALGLLRPAKPMCPAPPAAPAGRHAVYIAKVQPPPGEAAASEIALQVMLITFLAGHEAGHLYHGHTGVGSVTSVFRRPPESIPAHWSDEASADAAGIAAVWDGMEKHQEISIDISWLGPILALAYSAGTVAAYPATDVEMSDKYECWLFRLSFALAALAVNFRGNHFDIQRSMPIVAAAIELATAVYEYVRRGGDLVSDAPTLGMPGELLYDSLEMVGHDLLEMLASSNENSVNGVVRHHAARGPRGSGS